MRLDPLNIVLKQKFRPDKKIYFISGNEKTFIEKISSKIIEIYKKDQNVTISSIESINDYVDEVDLFKDKKLILIRNCKEINDESLKKLRDSVNVFIFSQENSQKIKKVKNIFLKDKDSYLIDCYELDKSSKVKILNRLIELSGINIDEDIYWFLIEKLDNKYVFLESSFKKILQLEKSNITITNIKKILTIDTSGKEKVFFNLFKKNKEIIEAYREKVITTSDVNEFYYYCKSFCQLIIESNNEIDYSKKIPAYLFKERDFLIDVYRKYNSKKKKMLLRLLSSVEIILRKENDLSLAFGLRFFLNLKKITTS